MMLSERPIVPKKTLDLTSDTTDVERAEHYLTMLSYWVAEAKWQTERANQSEVRLRSVQEVLERISDGIYTEAGAESAAEYGLRTVNCV